MLNYIVTVAISAFFVPHYLSIFWEPLQTNPWDIVGGAVVIVVLVALNIVGVKEAAKLNDRARGARLRHAGAARPARLRARLQPARPDRQHPLGRRADLVELRARDPGGDDRLHGDRDDLEPGRGGARARAKRPGAIKLVAVAVFAIYFTLPLVALSALPVTMIDGAADDAARASARAGRLRERPGPRARREPRPARGRCCAAEIYVGVLAATILFIATNAGVIGASRITYSMASYRQIPEVFRRLHPRFKTPWLALVLFAGIAADPDPPPGRGRLPRHAVLVRRDAVVHDRARSLVRAADEAAGLDGAVLPRAAEPPLSAASTGRCSRSSAASPPAPRSS